MASQLANGPQGRPELGQILIVIHDFSARSSDELSLAKGDRVELIERDDEFGDGWYLGRHLVNGNSGLFPEVYTRIAPRGPPSYPPTSPNPPKPFSVPIELPKEEVIKSPPLVSIPSVPEDLPITIKTTPPDNALDTDKTPQPSRHTSEILSAPVITSPLNTSNSVASVSQEPVQPAPLPTISTTAPIGQPKSVLSAAKNHIRGQDSPVMNETLSVIDEHITDMNSPHHSIAAIDRRGTNDSGSEYSSHLDHRLSYINGEETDEEEEGYHTRDSVNQWTPDQVAEFLFTAGVESKHCEVFRDQEITGDVLLGMDQTSVFLKEFDLGSVGRRLKTWQKIKGLQDEVNGEISTRRNTASYGSEVGSDDTGRHRSLSSSTMLTRGPSLMDRPGSRQHSRLSQQHASLSSKNDPSHGISPMSPKAGHENAKSAGDNRRPSAASIRDLHHSRQSSANEFSTISIMGAVSSTASPKIPDAGHKKQPSFDRNWTMGSASGSPAMPTRPLSPAGGNTAATNSTDHLSPNAIQPSGFDPLDRGYFSGGEAEGRARNVLRKRGSTTSHSRNSSYTDEQRMRSATATSRHSRFGSVDSVRDSTPPSASQKYYGLAAINGRRRSPSASSVNAPPRPMPPPKDIPSPTVTKLEGNTPPISPNSRRGTDWLLPVKPISSRHFGLRAISDAVTGHEKARVTSPTEAVQSSMKDSPLNSPSRTGSSTPSAGPSFELDSPDAKTISTMTTPGSNRPNKKKTKKETSAYTRGLEKCTPQEKLLTADYSGWMKKRNNNMLATWKPRLFILKGRRLSYFYSENDTEEKGVIDISFHRVLPADNDRLAGLHATLTGAGNSPISPPGAQATTIAAAEAAAEPQSSLKTSEGDSMFIFKLVPPRPGLSRAVSFTKPAVHYFAVPNIKQGRLWMAAIMKATIDRDDTKAITTTYQQKTISLAKARAMRHRPPALMNLDEHVDEEAMKTPASDKNGLNIQGIIFDREPQEGDSGVSGVSKTDGLNSDGANHGTGTFLDIHGPENGSGPRTA